MNETKRTSSIGRAPKTSSYLLAAGLVGVLATATSGIFFFQGVIERLTQRGDVTVSMPALTQLGALRVTPMVTPLAQLEKLDASMADARSTAKAEPLVQPRMERARVGYPSGRDASKISRRLTQKTRRLTVDRLPTVASSPMRLMTPQTENASSAEMLTIQMLHQQLQRRMISIGRAPQESPTEVTHDGYSSIREIENDEGEDTIGMPMSAARSVPPVFSPDLDAVPTEGETHQSTAIDGTAIPALRSVLVAAKKAEKVEPEKVLSVPAITPVTAKVKVTPALRLETEAEATAAMLDGIPEPTEIITPSVAVAKPTLSLQKPTVVKNAVDVHRAITPKDQSSAVEPAEPVAARLVDLDEAPSVMSTHRSRDTSAYDPTDDASDYSFVNESDDEPKSAEPRPKIGVSTQPSSQTFTFQEGEESPVVTSSTSPQIQIIKGDQTVSFTPGSAEATIAARVNTQSSKRKSGRVASAPDSSPAVRGVTRDSQGISIAWNSETTTSRELTSSISDKVAARASSPVKLPDPKRYCDSALIGTSAFNPAPSPEALSVCRRPLSLEGMAGGSQTKWWEVRESVDHWPTIIFQSDKEAFEAAGRIPMLSTQNARGLALLNKSKLLPTAGIVLGELPAGLEIELTGRSESVLYFDAQYAPLEKKDHATYFAYLNVAPGNPLLYVRQKSAKRGGSIPLVIRPGFVTYVKVPSPQAKTLSLRVLDSTSSTKALPVNGLSVRVIGQDGKTGVTNSRGEVILKEVLTFNQYPLYVDAAPDERAYKHRYRITPNGPKSRDLYYFNDQTVQGWTSQLDGGVSPLSGMVVGAFGAFPNRATEAYLRFQNIERRSPLTPEVYILGAEDHLMTVPKVDANHRRFIGVQVPEGTQIPSAIQEDGTLLFSEIAIVQPGVINVLSP